jgi:hypothetical protein
MSEQFAEGDIVRCICNNNGHHRMTIGNLYKVKSTSFQDGRLLVHIVTNTGSTGGYYASRFELHEKHKPLEFCTFSLDEEGL